MPKSIRINNIPINTGIQFFIERLLLRIVFIARLLLRIHRFLRPTHQRFQHQTSVERVLYSSCGG
jgi:hypothetical protein